MSDTATGQILSLGGGGNVGIGETSPETLLELSSTIPYQTLHNTTHEDTDGGRESRINFKGEQSGGEETTLARIEVSHDGAVDDEKGKIVFSTNDGSDTDTPTPRVTIDSAGITKIGDGGTTNYTAIDSGGFMEAKGSAIAYKDINMAGYLLGKPASSAPGIVTFVDENGADTTIETYGFAVDEKVHGGFELQHDYVEGTDLVFHVRWQGITAPTGTDNVQWRLNYILMRDGTTLNAAVAIDSPDTAFDTQYESVRTDFAAITGTNFLIGDQFMFTLTRVASTGDAYAGEALIATAGIHYQVNTIGSRAITSK